MTNTAEPGSTVAQLGSTGTDLATFLLARYADEVAEIDRVRQTEWGYDVTLDQRWELYGDHIEVGIGRSLADIEAKRQIVQWHDETDDCCEQRTGPLRFVTDPAEAKTVIGVDGSTGRLIGRQPIYGCVTMMMLALPYVDHPDCREEWKP